jgi:hypothetical protein
MECDYIDLIQFTHDRFQWWSFVNKNQELSSYTKFIEQLSDYQLVIRTLYYRVPYSKQHRTLQCKI